MQNLANGVNDYPGKTLGASWLALLLASVLLCGRALAQTPAAAAGNNTAKPGPAAAAVPTYTVPTAPNPSLRTLTRVSDIRELPVSEASRGYPVKVVGTVTFAESEGYSQFLQDASGGIYLNVPRTNEFGLKAGKRLEVTGFSGPGDFAPVIHVVSVRSLGTAPYPERRPVQLSTLLTGEEDSQWVSLRGVVRKSFEEDGRPQLMLAIGDSTLLVLMSNLIDRTPPTNYVDAEVEVHGVVTSEFNERRELQGVQLLVPEWKQIEILQPGSETIAELPPRQISDLLRFRTGSRTLHRYRVQGTVTFRQGNQEIFIQNGPDALHVQLSRPETDLQPGDQVELLGFPTLVDRLPVLQDATLIRLARNQPLTPRKILGEQAMDAALSGVLVEMTGQVAGHFLRAREENLTIHFPPSVFDVVLDRVDEGAARLGNIGVGSVVRVRGIYSATLDEGRNVRSFRILVSSPGDVAVMSTPSWWTLSRTLFVVGSMACVIAGSIGWGMLMRRKIERQTKLIQNQVVREADLERDFRELFENANDFIYTHDLKGRFTSINPAGLHLLGYASEEGRKLTARQVVAPEHHDLYLTRQADQVARREEATFEVELLTKDGRRIQVEVSSRPVFRAGVAVGVQGIARDISERKRTEQVIREKEEFIRCVIDTDPNRIFVKNREGRFILVNKAAADSHGKKVEEIVGRLETEINPNTEQVKCFQRDDREVMDTLQDKFITGERLTNRKGQTVWLQTVKRPIIGADGKANFVLGVATDITERKRSEVFLESILENLPIGIFLKDATSLQTVMYNAGAERLFGIERSFAIGRSDYDFFPKEQADQFTAKDREVLASGKLADIPEEEALTPHKGRRILHTRKVPIFDENGRPLYLLGIAEDITERKRADAFLQSIVENLPISVFLKDAKTLRTLMHNAGAEEVTGLSRAEVIGKCDHDFLPKEEADLFAAKDREALATGRLIDIPEETIQTPHRGKRLLHTRKVPIFDENNQPIYLLGISEDITERKAAEEELRHAKEAADEANRAKSSFLATMSHEIRTPMNAVIGMSNLLLDTPLNLEQRDFVQTVRNSGEALLAIINDILDFSKIEAGKLNLEMLDFDLRETVETTIDLLSSQAGEKRIELVCEFAEPACTLLRGDAGRLRQVLLNLASNAVKFTHQGEVVVKVSQEAETATHATLRVAIRDTGIGIAEEALQRLFQPFIQADGSTTRRFGGTGLGLAISKRLVELMGGTIGAQSDAGRGSVFWFTLCLEKQKNAVRAPFPAEQLARVRTLIVDDNATNRLILQRQLSLWEMPAESVESGAEALDLLRRASASGQPFELVLLDMQMPEMDGVMLAALIQRDSLIRLPRLILQTSLCCRPPQSELARVGITGCLIKPVKQSDLFNTLLRVLAVDPARLSGDTTRLRRPVAGAEVPVIPKANVRILLAEDNPVNQKLALKQLQKLGYSADSVANGLEVLEAVKRTHYDIILMDCQMPDMDGYETTQRLRADPGLCCRPENPPRIIALTADAMAGDRERCLAVGMDNYLSKPLQMEGLRLALENALISRTPEPVSA